MEEKYKRFLEFNWKDCEAWQLYYSNLSETPPPSKIEHFKKRFYKFNIDPDFDVKWIPATTSYTTPNQSNYSRPTYQYQGNISSVEAMRITSPFLVVMEAIGWIAFIISVPVQFHALKIACLALFIRVFRRLGSPKFSIEYIQQLFLDEHFHQVLYSVLLMMDRFNFYAMVPLGITAVLNLCEYFRSKPLLFSYIISYCNKIMNKRVELASMRANVEIALGFLLVLAVLFRINWILTPLFYWQYLRFKYIVNDDTKNSFSQLNRIINNFKNSRFVPRPISYIISKIQQFSAYMGSTDTEPGQTSFGPSCLIY